MPADDLPHLLKWAGEDNLVIGTDYGHYDLSTESEALRHLRTSGLVDKRTYARLPTRTHALYGL